MSIRKVSVESPQQGRGPPSYVLEVVPPAAPTYLAAAVGPGRVTFQLRSLHDLLDWVRALKLKASEAGGPRIAVAAVDADLVGSDGDLNEDFVLLSVAPAPTEADGDEALPESGASPTRGAVPVAVGPVSERQVMAAGPLEDLTASGATLSSDEERRRDEDGAGDGDWDESGIGVDSYSDAASGAAAATSADAAGLDFSVVPRPGAARHPLDMSLDVSGAPALVPEPPEAAAYPNHDLHLPDALSDLDDEVDEPEPDPAHRIGTAS